MNADEASRIERRLELAERVVDDVLASVRAGERQLVLREKVRHARHIEDRRAIADARRHAFERTGDRSPRKEWRPVPDKLRRELARELTYVGPRLPAQALELVERAIEPLGLDRLQEIVDRIHREGIDRVFVIRGGEDDERIAVEALQQIESGQPGHLDVQEQHIDVVRAKKRHRRFRIRRAAHDLDARGCLKQTHQPLHRQPLVVDDVGTQHRCSRSRSA